MTATTSKLGADMLTDEQIAQFGYAHSDEHDEPLFAFDRAGFIACVRALLAGQPAAIDKEAVLSRDQIRAVFMARGFTIKDGQTDLKQYVYDAAEDLIAAVLAIAAPLDKEAGKPAAQQTLSDGAQYFACYLIDNCENEIVREESVQAWLGKMLASPRYHPVAPSVEQESPKEQMERMTRESRELTPLDKWARQQSTVAPSVEQDERGALTDQQVYDKFGFLEGLVSEHTYRKIADTAIEIERAASTSANVAQGAEAVAWREEAQKLFTRCKLWPEKSDDGFMALLELRNHVEKLLKNDALTAAQSASGDTK